MLVNQPATAARLFVLMPEGKEEPKKVLLCSCQLQDPPTDCICVGPGTPWWRALNEADVDDLAVVHLPQREECYRVHEIERVAA